MMAESYAITAQQAYQNFKTLSTASKAYYGLAAIAAYIVARTLVVAIYRIWFHPLSSFPGPTWAKVTGFYEFYYESIKYGQLTYHAREVLHPKYGPIVRVGPNKLRINDHNEWYTVHSVGSRFNKDPAFYGGLGVPACLVNIEDNKEHLQRRSLINKLFSKKSMLRLEPLVWERGDILVDVIRNGIADAKRKGTDYLFDSHRGCQAVVQDIVMKFSFGRFYDLTTAKDFDHDILHLTDKSAEGFPVGKHFPWLHPILQSFPPWVADMMMPGVSSLHAIMHETAKDIRHISEEKRMGTYKAPAPDAPPTLFAELVDVYPGEAELVADSVLVHAAGTNTTSWAMASSLYYFSSQPEIQTRLRNELLIIWPNKSQKPTYEQLEKLPYLTAFLKELLRISYGIMGGLPRIAPANTTLCGRKVPEGTIIDMAPYEINSNPEIFPDPFKFDPERWLRPDSGKLEKYVVSFGTGSRICAGIHMAWLELYTLIPLILRNFDIVITDKLKEEGWVFVERWIPIKRGDRGWFIMREFEG